MTLLKGHHEQHVLQPRVALLLELWPASQKLCVLSATVNEIGPYFGLFDKMAGLTDLRLDPQAEILETIRIFTVRLLRF